MVLLDTLLTAGWLLILSSGTRAIEVRLCQGRRSQEITCQAEQRLALSRTALMDATVSSTPSPCTFTAPSHSVALPPWGLHTLLSQAGVAFSLCLLESGACTVDMEAAVFGVVQATFSDVFVGPFSVMVLDFQCVPAGSVLDAREAGNTTDLSVFLVQAPPLNPVPQDVEVIQCWACANSLMERLEVSILEMPVHPASLCSVTFQDEFKNRTLNCSSAGLLSDNPGVDFSSAGAGVNITIAQNTSLDSRIVLNITAALGQTVTLRCGEPAAQCPVYYVTSALTSASTTTVSPPWIRYEVVFNARNPSQLLECQETQHIALSDVTFNEESCESYTYRLPSMQALVLAALTDRVIQPCSFKQGVCNVSLSEASYHVDLTQYHPEAQTPAIRVALGYKCVNSDLVAEPGKDLPVAAKNVYLAVHFSETLRQKNITCAACCTSFYDRIRVDVLDIPKSTNTQCNLTLTEEGGTVSVGCTDRTLLLYMLYTSLDYRLSFSVTFSENFTATGPLWINVTSQLGLPLQLWCARDGRTAACPTLSPTTPYVPTTPSTAPNSTGDVIIEPASPEGLSIGSIVGICGGSAIVIVIVVSIALVVRNKIRNSKKSVDPSPHADPDDDDDEDESDDVEAGRRPRTAAPGSRGQPPTLKRAMGHLAPLDHEPQRRRKKKKTREFKRPMRDPFSDPKPQQPRPVPAALLPKPALPPIAHAR